MLVRHSVEHHARLRIRSIVTSFIQKNTMYFTFATHFPICIPVFFLPAIYPTHYQ